jgi:hypothetical protein
MPGLEERKISSVKSSGHCQPFKERLLSNPGWRVGDTYLFCDTTPASSKPGVINLAKKTKKRKRVAWTKTHHAELRKHSKARTPVTKISKLMKRTIGALRQQALKLGIGLGHRR